ncbi:MAG: hypothetical protein HYX86_05820 [Chloroflexi bacterium]|nr:hypothetical protein [Chloroflexota bacterium]
MQITIEGWMIFLVCLLGLAFLGFVVSVGRRLLRPRRPVQPIPAASTPETGAVSTVSAPPEEMPAKSVTPAPAPPAKKGRGCLATCLIILVLGVVALCLLGAAGYYLYTTGAINQRQILNAIGQGTGEINLVNASDDTLEVSLTHLDTESGEPESVGSFTLEPEDINGFTSIQPGRYQLQITYLSGASGSGVCTMRIVSGDYYQLVAINGGVVIANKRQPAQTGEDLVMATSPLCQQ